ncbi:MAG: hypothetical protein ACK559_06335, partial [bacterium]
MREASGSPGLVRLFGNIRNRRHVNPSRLDIRSGDRRNASWRLGRRLAAIVNDGLKAIFEDCRLFA